MRNRRWLLRRHPQPGELIGADHFSFDEALVAAPEAGQVLVRTCALGTSPAQRAYAAEGVSMHEKVVLGDVMRGRGIGVVLESKHPLYRPGDVIEASLGWQEFATLTPRPELPGILRIDKIAQPMRPLTRHLGVLGGTGATAWFGLFEIGRLRAGDLVVVSAAAGGVGAVAVQIAKQAGARVIGIAGGPDKAQWLVGTLGADAAIDYKNESISDRLKSLAPDGVDLFFDNVGGAMLDAVLLHLAIGARIAICGFISTSQGEKIAGPSNYAYLLRRRARMEGFFVMDYVPRWGEAHRPLRRWLEDGSFDPVEDVAEGIEQMPASLASLFTGANRGIKLVRVAEDP